MLNGDILINGNKIEKIGSNIDDTDNVIDCKGNILLPGFKNAHAHTAMTFLRGGGEGLPLQEWLFTYCFPREDKLTPSDVYYATKVGIVEYIQAIDIHNAVFTFKSFYNFDISQVSSGGVALSNLTPSLESKLEKNVFFIGEIVDVDAKCGGFNLMWAFASAEKVAKSL